MNELQFETLLNLLKPHHLNRSHRKPLTPEQKLCMTLKYLAQGGSRQSLAWQVRVDKSTVSKVIDEDCISVWNILDVKYTEKSAYNGWQDY
ncbi:hypothetical protein PR048_029756 [Dryococelus australis]|uniref:Transposase n=1 Tax=Dryococelus australis TaxID=614101 RepID=A0ABQ9GG18_9NEOP|nr:hypothetical protein PR048_029756 [Dryococelus australis]